MRDYEYRMPGADRYQNQSNYEIARFLIGCTQASDNGTAAVAAAILALADEIRAFRECPDTEP